MGILCPICQTHQAQVQVFTADGSSPKSAHDVVARKLACGHTIGGPEHAAYVKRISEIDVEAWNATNKIKEKAQAAKAAAWQALQNNKDGE